MAERFKLNRFTDRLTLRSHTGTLEQKSKLRGNVRCLSAGWSAFQIRLFRLMQSCHHKCNSVNQVPPWIFTLHHELSGLRYNKEVGIMLLFHCVIFRS